MTHRSHTVLALAVLLIVTTAPGCFTRPGTQPSLMPPVGSIFRPRIEYCVGDFGFAWGNGELTESTLDGRLLTSEILDAWTERGYAVGPHFVPSGEFSGKAEYNLTLIGNQRNVANFFLEAFNAFTVFIFPYPVTRHYDLTYVLEDVTTGKTYSANVEGWDVAYISLLVLPGLPFALSGHHTTIQQLGDSLYEQFRRDGAFEFPCPPAPAQAP